MELLFLSCEKQGVINRIFGWSSPYSGGFSEVCSSDDFLRVVETAPHKQRNRRKDYSPKNRSYCGIYYKKITTVFLMCACQEAVDTSNIAALLIIEKKRLGSRMFTLTCWYKKTWTLFWILIVGFLMSAFPKTVDFTKKRRQPRAECSCLHSYARSEPWYAVW